MHSNGFPGRITLFGLNQGWYLSTQELIYFLLYVLSGPFAWICYGALIVAGRRKMMYLKRPPLPLPKGMVPPSVSIIVPAKDEGERIRGCIESCLNQDYADFEVIAVDDRSVDNTGRVMDEMAAGNPRLKVVHIQEGTLGPGWTGKNNALFTAQKQARGQWLLFVDSDVVLQPDALTASMSVVQNKQFDLISLLPRLESHTIWESTLVPLAAAAASAMYVIAFNNMNHKKNSAFANGQFILMSRTVYDAMGGHEAVKDRYCEDVAIALRLKQAGYRPRIAWGNDWAAVRMYSSLPAIFRGWSRIYYAARVGSPWRTLAAISFLLQCCFTAYLMIPMAISQLSRTYANPITPLDPYAWAIAVATHLVVMHYYLGKLYHWSGNPRRNSLFFIIAGPMVLMIMLRSVWMCVTKKVTWRGTSYGHVMASKLTEVKPAAIVQESE